MVCLQVLYLLEEVKRTKTKVSETNIQITLYFVTDFYEAIFACVKRTGTLGKICMGVLTKLYACKNAHLRNTSDDICIVMLSPGGLRIEVARTRTCRRINASRVSRF